MKKLICSFWAISSMIALAGCSNAKETTTQEIATGEETTAQVYPDTLTLVFFGDAMQHKMQLDRAHELGTEGNPYNFDDCFALVTPALKDADYSIVNLETPLGGPGTYAGYPMFSAPDSYAVALKNAGFDLFLTSNNHALDKRDKGVRRTLHVLDSLGVDHIGTYDNAADRSKKVPFIKEINGMKIGFLNYTYGTNGLEAKDGAEVAYIDMEKAKQEIEATRKAGAEYIVVMPHWGIEYKLNENERQHSQANQFLQSGADMVIGGHPHVVQPMKVMTDTVTGKRNLVVYSLGNFISNMTTDNTRGGAFVRVVLERDKDGKVAFRNAEYDTFITETPSGSGTNFRVVPSWAIDQLPASQKSRWTKHDAAVTKLYDQYNVDVPRSKRKY